MDDEPSQGQDGFAENAAYDALNVVNLKQEADKVAQGYKNYLVTNVNDHAIRLAVMQGEFPWHYHPHSDECFLILEGELEIDMRNTPTVILKPGDLFTMPAGTVHRTRARQRTVNLCFEDRGAYRTTIFESGVADPLSRATPGSN